VENLEKSGKYKKVRESCIFNVLLPLVVNNFVQSHGSNNKSGKSQGKIRELSGSGKIAELGLKTLLGQTNVLGVLHIAISLSS